MQKDGMASDWDMAFRGSSEAHRAQEDPNNWNVKRRLPWRGCPGNEAGIIRIIVNGEGHLHR